MTAFRSSSLPGFARRSATVAACLALLPVNGCLGHHYVKTDFKSYELAFADTSNREMLLNLARLENRDPAYFFKMGQITSSYRMQGSLTGAGQVVAAGSSTPVQIPTGGGTPGVIFENDPTFQFIPVNDDTNARLLMAPIQPDTFYALYEQGWRLDQLFRLLVDRIEVTQTTPDGVCSVEIFRNSPPTGIRNPSGEAGPSVSSDGSTRYDPVALSHYVTFLRVSALVYEMQRSGILVLRGTDQFVPYDPNGYIPLRSGNETAPPSGPSARPGTGSNTGDSGGVIQAKDQNDAIARNDIWERKMDGNTQIGWVLGRKVFSAVFYLSPMKQNADGSYSSDPKTVKDNLRKYLGPDDEDWHALDNGKALDKMLAVMSRGFSLEGTPNPGQAQQNMCPAAGGPPVAHLYMRSMIELMAASAQEQGPFYDLLQKNPLVPPDPQDPTDDSKPGLLTVRVPKVEQQPVLRLRWDGVKDFVSPLVSVTYRDKPYSVTDPEPPPQGVDDPHWVAANATWNRDMFRLIEGLSSQVTVDISKFPLPEILQLHSD